MTHSHPLRLMMVNTKTDNYSITEIMLPDIAWSLLIKVVNATLLIEIGFWICSNQSSKANQRMAIKEDWKDNGNILRRQELLRDDCIRSIKQW